MIRYYHDADRAARSIKNKAKAIELLKEKLLRNK